MRRRLSIRYLLKIAVFFVLALVLTRPRADAHSMNMYAYVEGNEVHGEVFARGGTPFIGTNITAYGPDGETLGETKTDDEGNFSLPATKRCHWRLVAETEDGHQAEYTVPAAEFSTATPTAEPAPSEPPKSTPPPSETAKEPSSAPATPVAPAADGETEDLARQISALRRELHQVREDLRWQDMIGGVGYILGLMGLTFYFLGVRKRDRCNGKGNVD